MKFLEYDKFNGHIICELISTTYPEETEKTAFLEISSDEEFDTSLYVIQNGAIVKRYESIEERLERERLKRERAEEYRSRMKSIPIEFVFALMHDDEVTAKKLKAELKNIERFL